MKTNTFSLLASIALLSFASCTDEMQELAGEQTQALKQIVMTTQDFQTEAGSRTLYEVIENVKCTWADNDTVGVFPNEGAQVYFPMASGAGTKNATFNGGGWALKDGSTYGAYYPCIGKFYLDKNAVPVNYTGQMQVGNASMTHLGAYDYMVASPTAPQGGAAQFTFKHLSALVQLKITVSQPATFTSVKLVTDTEDFAVEGTVDIMADVPVITPTDPANEVVLDLQNVATTQENEVVTFYFMLPPADLSEQTLKAVLVSDKGNIEIDYEGKNFQAGTVYVLSGKMESTEAGYKDGVVTISEAGTLKQLLGDDFLNIASLKIVGPINGDDVLSLRQMLGGSEFSDTEKGTLTSLDLSEATIVEGGGAYYDDYSKHNYTANDEIGEHMFYRCTNLQEIMLPDGAISINDAAFAGCSSLASIKIPVGVTSLGSSAFSGCSSLVSIELPASITSIDYYAFENCSSLAFIKIPVGVTSIVADTFNACSSLASIELPAGITSIGDYAFQNCSSLASIELPASVTSIGIYAFNKCSSLVSINIPDGVTAIYRYTFSECSSLASIELPAGITSIGDHAFYCCFDLASINIPASVSYIENTAFGNCHSLTSVNITDLSAWCNITFSDSSSNPLNKGAKLYLNNKELTELVIPADIKRIKDYTFYSCNSITKVTMGEQVTSVGIHSFRNCSSLAQVYCQGTTPPTINSSSTNSSFSGSGSSRTLYVPNGCSSIYQSSGWASFFGTITEME